MEPLFVRIGSYRVARSPATLASYGLGSCVAIAIYDARSAIGGLAHAMLPSFEAGPRNDDPKKYVDRLIAMVVEEMARDGARPHGITAKVAGGATMFPPANGIERISIGSRNVASAEACLSAMGIPLVSKDVGGAHGRTVSFRLESGELVVRASRIGERRL